MRCIAAALGIISLGLFALFTAERASSPAQPAVKQAVVERAPAIPAIAESTNAITVNTVSEPKIVATPDGFILSGVRAVPQSAGTGMKNLALPVIPGFPKSFASPMRVRCGKADVTATPAGARDSAGHIEADGSLVYSNAFDGCDVRYRCEALKTEEFIVVRQPASAQSRMEWSWELKTGGLTPHLTPAFTIELWDAAGVPRLRINEPEGKDAAGKQLCLNKELSLALQGSRLTLSADLSGCKFPVTIDPTWSSTGAMTTLRNYPTATTLGNGKVLIVGGQGSSGPLNSAELYDPATGTWAATGAPGVNIWQHTATLLNSGPNSGKVLAAGGTYSSNGSPAIASCELYDPVAGTWSATGSLTAPTAGHTATLLINGKVLVAGGGNGGATTNAVLYDPVAGTWSATGSMANFRAAQSATLLPNGNVLVAGGAVNQTLCELYNPATGTWSNTGSMATGRRYHPAILLANGKVLVAGGQGSTSSSFTNLCELYDPGAGTWSTTGPLATARGFHCGVLLGNGKVLVAAGYNGTILNSAELYDPVAGTWNATYSLLHARNNFAATTFGGGKVLVAGGNGTGVVFPPSEVFDPTPVAKPQTVSVSAGSSVPITFQSDSIDSSVSYAIVAPSAQGLITGTPPNLTYTPNSGFTGTDTFTYHATDTLGTGPTATVTINVNPVAAVITSLSPDATTVGAAITTTLTGSNFVTSSVVLINSTTCATTYVSTTQLIAVIPASALGTAGQIPITVSTPTSGAISQPANLFVYSGATVGTWIVSNTLDDNNPGSLRFAMTNCRKGDLILFDPNVFNLTNADLATVINVLSPLPSLDKGSVTIDAQDQRVTVNGSGAGPASGFVMTSDGNKIFGLSILAFTGSGVSISGGKNNTIGGDRTLGAGINGQGIRIAKCGAAGIELTSGACNNSILGCWIGLDSSGSVAEPNLGGILIQNQSCTNVIGGSTPGQANVISGNEFEGITVSDTGTDDNVIQGNIIGATAVTISSRDVASGRSSALLSFGTRTSLGNGGAGIFLSRGTKGSVVGAAANDPDAVLLAKSNILAFNGGNGIEVRATVSKQNASRGNLISNNIRGGITLFDGSNSGINPPLMSSMTNLGTRTGGGSFFQIQGTATDGDGSPGNGMIEIFSDPGTQGQNLLVRVPVTNGAWTAQAAVTDVTMNVNATYTDANGNTSSFGTFGTPPSGATPFGVLDQLAGIDPSNPATAPLSTDKATADKFKAGLNFAKPKDHDSLQSSMLFTLPSNFAFDSTTVAIVVNEVGVKATLDPKGRAASNGATLKLLKPKSGSPAVLQLSIRNQSLAAYLAGAGLTNQTTSKSGVQVTIPIGVALITKAGTYLYQGNVTATYKAIAGKSGKASK